MQNIPASYANNFKATSPHHRQPNNRAHTSSGEHFIFRVGLQWGKQEKQDDDHADEFHDDRDIKYE